MVTNAKSVLLSWSYYCCDKTWPKQNWGGNVVFHLTAGCQSSREVRARNYRQKLEQGSWGLLLTELLSLFFFYSSQDHQPRYVTDHSGVALPLSIIYKENSLQDCLQINQIEHFLSSDSFFPDDPSLCHVDIKTSQQTWHRPYITWLMRHY